MSRPSFIGQTLGGRYRIDEILGQGGMSAVYKAYDPNLKRVVAVKIIHAHLADDPQFITRFEEEAAAVAQLRHPNIVQVFDFNHDGDLYYMVQEFVPGETLQLRLRRLNQSGKRMSAKEAAQFVSQIADAVSYAHQRGMIHRDIKPANIMLDVHGQAILMDFGIVKILGGTRHTATGAVVGTAQYLPPELIRGETPDPRSDIYSLGVTLFEMVNGRPPFEADSAMTLMMMHLNDPLPDLRQLRPEVPEELIAIIEKALQKDRNLRYSSMNEMAAALRRIFDHPGRVIPQPRTIVDEPSQPQTFPAQPRPRSKAPVESPAVASPSAPYSPPRGAIAQSEASKSVSGAVAFEKISPSSTIARVGGGTGENAMPGSGALPVIPPAQALKKVSPAVWVGGAILLLLIVLGGIFVVGGIYILPRIMNTGGQQAASLTGLPTEIEQAGGVSTQAVAQAPAFTDTPTPTLEPSVTFTPSPTLPPTDTPTPTLIPTPTIPVGVPYVRINGITVDSQKRYVVEYETFEFTEKLPGVHIHFFFDTVLPEQAGHPGKGPWYLYGGPRPFTGYKQADRPKNAAQMCALVANPNHSVQLESGTCAILPDVVAALPLKDTACLVGPSPEYPAVASLSTGQVVLVRGISDDENWWNVANPEALNESCWVSGSDAQISGDISTLPLIEAPPLPTDTIAPEYSVEITNITIDSQGRYVVEYVTRGFTEKLPGMHIHFFFNNIPPDQVGISGGGNRRMYGGPSPFSSYRTSDRPAAATQMCALVANPDHSVIFNSGNCFALPDV